MKKLVVVCLFMLGMFLSLNAQYRTWYGADASQSGGINVNDALISPERYHNDQAYNFNNYGEGNGLMFATEIDLSTTTPTLPGDPTSDPPIGSIPVGSGGMMLLLGLIFYVLIKQIKKKKSA